MPKFVHAVLMAVALLAVPVVAIPGLPAAAGTIVSSVDAATLPEGKRTMAGLYLTSRDAAAALAADPAIVLIDVRSQPEFGLVGHPDPVDSNVPGWFLTDRFDPASGSYALEPNPRFVLDVGAVMARLGKGKDAPVFVICRSGGRSAAAANLLVQAGYSRVYSIVDGFEGEQDPASGHRTIGGWRNSDLPWTFRIAPEQAYAPAQP